MRGLEWHASSTLLAGAAKRRAFEPTAQATQAGSAAKVKRAPLRPPSVIDRMRWERRAEKDREADALATAAAAQTDVRVLKLGRADFRCSQTRPAELAQLETSPLPAARGLAPQVIRAIPTPNAELHPRRVHVSAKSGQLRKGEQEQQLSSKDAAAAAAETLSSLGSTRDAGELQRNAGWRTGTHSDGWGGWGGAETDKVNGRGPLHIHIALPQGSDLSEPQAKQRGTRRPAVVSAVPIMFSSGVGADSSLVSSLPSVAASPAHPPSTVIAARDRPPRHHVAVAVVPLPQPSVPDTTTRTGDDS
jgi:hypothetical protein